MQQCSPRAQSLSLSHRNTWAQPCALGAHAAVVRCMASFTQQSCPADLSQNVSPQRIFASPGTPPVPSPESGAAPPVPRPESSPLPPLPPSGTGSPPAPPVSGFPPVGLPPL